jgi:hypothetical protein
MAVNTAARAALRPGESRFFVFSAVALSGAPPSDLLGDYVRGTVRRVRVVPDPEAFPSTQSRLPARGLALLDCKSNARVRDVSKNRSARRSRPSPRCSDRPFRKFRRRIGHASNVSRLRNQRLPSPGCLDRGRTSSPLLLIDTPRSTPPDRLPRRLRLRIGGCVFPTLREIETTQ